jgi:uncharacterized protein YecT (DUF1311 family)
MFLCTSQVELNSCYDRLRQVADDELNRTYQHLMSRASDQGLKIALRDAERAWISYRDKECEFESSNVRGGSAYMMVFAICLTEKIQARTKELSRILDCKQTDLDCPL